MLRELVHILLSGAVALLFCCGAAAVLRLAARREEARGPSGPARPVVGCRSGAGAGGCLSERGRDMCRHPACAAGSP